MITHFCNESGFLTDQSHFIGEVGEVIGTQLSAITVFQRRDDAAPVGVGLWVGSGDQEDIQRQPQRIAPYLDVARLQDIEQRNLNTFGQIGKLIETEYASVGTRHEPVV